MSRRRSALTTAVVLGVFGFLYSLVLAIPVHVGEVEALWSSRGLDWVGSILRRMVDGFSFLWGSAVVDSIYPVASASAGSTVAFVVLLVIVVYASLRTASDNAFAVAGRVLCASVLAGGLTNLYVVLQTVLITRGGPESLPSLIWAVPDDGIWLGLVVGVLGGYAAYVAAALAMVAAIALRDGQTVADDTMTSADDGSRWSGAARVATWGTLPLLVLALVGGFVWDYAPDADPTGAPISARDAWVRLIWFAHASLAPPHNPYSLSGSFDTEVWLPRTLTSAALVALVWLVLLLVAARRSGTSGPGAAAVVVQCWGLVAVLAGVLGLVEGAIVQQEEFATAAQYWALETAARGLRFGACFGWASGVAVVLARRLMRGTLTDDSAGS